MRQLGIRIKVVFSTCATFVTGFVVNLEADCTWCSHGCGICGSCGPLAEGSSVGFGWVLSVLVEAGFCQYVKRLGLGAKNN